MHFNGNRLNETVKLRFRNGYIIQVDFDRQNCRFVRMHDFFKDFSMKGGEILFFQYASRGVLDVFIIGADFGEIDYPAVVHSRQDSTPPNCKSLFCLCFGTSCMIHG